MLWHLQMTRGLVKRLAAEEDRDLPATEVAAVLTQLNEWVARLETRANA